ncbi:MAG: AAA family ATPase [Lactobacillus johnsonii]|nr:AAA family ATPase [Lactobacillus johnsonii]
MEKSILGQYPTDNTPSKAALLGKAMDTVNAQYSPITNIKTGYDRNLETTPLDDYEYAYLLNKETPEETLKDKSYLRDAWTTFANNRDQINLMSERAKLVKDINPVIEDIDYELQYLNDKKMLLNLENVLPTMDKNSQEYQNTLQQYEILKNNLEANSEKYNAILAKYNDSEGTDVDKRIEYLNGVRDWWVNEQSEVNKNIQDYYDSITSRSEKYKPSARFQIKEQKAQDKPFYDSDYILYAGPGLTGSSMSTIGSYVADALATGALYLGRHYATTGALNAVPGAGAVSNLIGWGSAITAAAISLAGNIYSRHRESLAQVYGAYRSKIEKDLESKGVSIQDYVQVGRDQLKQQNPNIDVTKISDDEIIDRTLSGEIKISDEVLNSLKDSADNGLENVYNNNMALSAMDVAQSALIFAPLGKAMGKIITKPIAGALKPLVKLSDTATKNYNKLIDAYTGFNARLAYNSPKMNMLSKGAKALARMGFAATGEAFEEGNQDIFDYDYIHNQYDKDSSGVFSSLLGLAEANYRTAKILSGIDTESELANDPQFWNDVKGGFALGMYLGGPTTAYHAGIDMRKDFVANTFVRDMVADNIAKKDAMNKAVTYADRASKSMLNYKDSVLEVLENFKYHMPDGLTEEDINAEIKTANNVFNLAKSKTTKNIGKQLGYSAGTTEYNTLIGLQHVAQLDLQEAVNNAKAAQDADNKLYADLSEDALLSNYTPEEKLAAITLTKLNVQKEALQELKNAIEAPAEDGKTKFGITNSDNSVAKSILKTIPKAIKNIDSQLAQVAADTKFSTDFVAAPHVMQTGVDSYANLMLAQHDALVAEHKMNEIFGNTLEDGKLTSFDKATDKSKKKVLNNIKKRIENYLNNSDESSRIAEDNAKQIVEQDIASTEKEVADNGTDNNETVAASKIAPEVQREEVEKPQSPVMDSRAKSKVNTEIPAPEPTVPEATPETWPEEKTEPAIKRDEEFPTKSLEELAAEFEAERKRIAEENKPKAPVVEDVEEEDEEFAFATDKDLRAAANADADPLAAATDEDKKVSQTVDTITPDITVEQKVEQAKKKLATEQKHDSKTDMDSESREYEDSLEVEELAKDTVSHTLFFSPDSTTPILPGYKSGKELAERIKDPNFFTDSFCEFIINESYTEKGSKPYKKGDKTTYDSASIILSVEHPTGKYALALKTPKGARIKFDADIAGIRNSATAEELNTIEQANEVSINDLKSFRNAIITAIENKTENEVIVPSTISRTRGRYNVNRNGQKAVFRPVQEVKGFAIPSNVYDITPENVIFGISNGIISDSLILGAGGEILNGTGGSGQLFIYPPKSSTLNNSEIPVQVNLQRFDRKQAEFLADLLLNYGASPESYYKNTEIVAGELIDFMVRFGDKTKVTSDIPTFNWMKKKQLYVNDKGDLVVGEKSYHVGNMSSQDKEDLINDLMGFHWRANRENFFSPIGDALPSLKEAFTKNSSYIWEDAIPGIILRREDFLGNTKHTPLYTMGLFVTNDLIQSDLQDQLFKDSFAYADDIQTISKKVESDKAVEETKNKVENIANIPTGTSAVEPEELTEESKKINEITKNGTIDPFAIEDDDIDIPMRRLTGKVTKEVSNEEIEWFKKKLGFQSDSLTIVDDAISLGNNVYAMGLVRQDSTLLWKGAEIGTLYHEAYHRISLLTISPKERRKIYEAYRNRTGLIGTDKDIEEALAEDFRQYMLNKVEPDLNIIKRAWKAIKNFISKWVWRTDTTIDNIFDRINTGYYSRSKQNSAAVQEFLNAYKGAGAPFKLGGHNFKNITNTQFKESVNSLVASLFTLNNIKMRDDLTGLNYSLLKSALEPSLTDKLVENGKITKEQGEARKEIYETFDSVFLPAIIRKLNEYQIRAVDKQENIDQEIDEKAEGSAVGDQMATYIRESLETSVKDNALASIKIFIATMPKREFYEAEVKKEDGTITKVQKTRTVLSPVTGLPLMVDFDSTWNTIINELHSENTFEGMMNKCAKCAKSLPIFDTLYRELYKISKTVPGESEAQVIARENLQTQFRNTFRKAKHKLIGILSEKIENTNGNDQTNLYVKDENANKISKNIIEGWNYGLLRMTELINFDGNNYTLKTTDNKTNVELLLDDYHKINNLLKNYKNKPNAKLKNGQTYKEYVEANVIKIKEHILSLLGRAGVSVDMATLNSFLIKEYYDSNTAEQLVNLFTDGSNAGLAFLFSNKLKDVLKIEPSGNVPGTFNRHISRYYDDSKFLGRLSETYGMTHPNLDELAVLATDGKLLYPISDHNYLTDMVQNLDNDPATVEALTKVLYNTGNNANPNYFKGSYLLTNLYNNPTTSGKIGVETLVYFKEQGGGDKGRKYTEISPLEDYIAKMTLTQKGRIVLPTMGDSQTYNTLYGTAINNFNQPLDTTNNKIKFNAKVLTRFINYFETELDTIEFNYKNEGNLTKEQKVKNYDTGNRNGYRFRYFNGFFKLKEQPTLGGIEFVDDFSDFNEALKLAEDVGGNDLALSVVNQIKAAWAKMSNSDKALLMNEYLIDAFKDELDYAKEIGIIDWNGRDFASVKSLALPQKALDDAENHYKKRQEVSKYSKELAATELMANYFANTISSVIEFEKLFIKDPAYYKDPVDKIKRLREVLSTGVTPRIDYGEGNELSNLTEVNVGTLSDNVIPSRQLDRINEFAKKSAAVRLLQEMHDMTQEEALAMYESGEALPQDVEDAANLVVDSKFGGYTKVNQTDATVLISPEFYKELVRRIDGWSPEVAKAFDILNNPETDYEADADTYNEALAVTLKPLKLMYFGDHYDVNAKRDIPVFDKMAMFPVHRIFSTGDMGEVLKVMQARNIHMLAFESAVKVGQRVEEVKSKIYTDKSNTKVDIEGLMNMPTHKQSLVNFRRQLVTDPHHADRQMFVSQAQKAAMGNIRTAWTYTTPNGVSYSGQEVIDNFNGAHNAITEFGRKSIEKDFGIDANNPQASIVKFANILKRKAENSNMNDNVLNGLTVEDGNTNAPISGLSDNSWIESGLISMLNKAIVDTNLPGGMFIQMSSILYNRLAVTSDINNVRKLNFVNNDGSMDCVISINLLKHIIPNYDKMTFSQAKEWLIKHDIIGQDTKAIAMGYRIPAQGQASTAALKVIDVYPEQIGDTITLPDEFTALTGSDFDIDKLFIARYNYDNNGNRIKFETKDQYVQRLRATGLDDETVVRKAYERYNGKTDFEANSREANENMLLDMYLSVISNPMNFAEARQPLDTVTDYLKDKILKDVDKLTGQGKRTSKSQLYFSTPAFQSRTKAELNGGKFGIGPFALANAHQVLTQLVKLNFKPNKVLSDYGIRDLHHIQSEDTNKINVLDWLSALINAHVDVAKDPYIIRLNVRKLTFNMTNFLIRSGKGESTFYFLPQQILKDYATEYDKYSGFYGVEIPAGKNPERLAFTKIWNDYYKKAKELSGGKKEDLLNYLKDKGVGTNQRKAMFTVSHLRKQLQKTETFDWYYNQLLILKAYEELTPFSKSLSELTNLSQIDTKRFGNNFGLQSAFLDKWKQYMTEQAVFDNPLKVFTNTFLGKKMIDGLVFPRNAFQNVMIRLTPEFETLRSLIEYYTKGYAISDDTYINNITRAMEVSYKTKFFNQYVKDNQMGFRGMLFGKDSISRRLDRLKSDILQDKYPSLLGSDGSFSNVLINNIFSRPKEDDAELQGPDFIAYKPNKSGDNNLENEIIRAWEELYESDYKEVREFAKDLAIYSFYTSGDAFGKNNIFRYVPNSIREEIGYFDYIRELEKHPENVISQIDLQEVIRNLWWNDHVVPAIEYYKLDSSYETIEEEGRAVYRPVAHDDSGLFVTNKKGEQVEIPSIIYDESSKFRGIVGYNEAGNPIHYLYKKVKLDKNNDPRTTFLYKYIGIDENKVPVYQLINKKGLSYKGNVLVEFGFKKSSVGYNNIVPTGLDFTPSKAITYVQDLTPVKASLQTKIFNQAGEFNENALQTVSTENVDLQNTEPLAYQEWSKTYQSRNGEAASQEAYQQYLDNFEYGAKKQVPTQDVTQYLAPGEENNQIIQETIQLAKEGLKLTNEIGEFFSKEEQELIKKATSTTRLFVKSASRRTDPVFFTEELINQLKENAKLPFGDPKRFYAMEIWSKHDGLPMVDLINACIKYRVAPINSFSISTLGDTSLEPGVMKPNDLLDAIEALIKDGKINPETTTIRIDPLVPGVTKLEDIENVVKRGKELGITKFVSSVMQSYGFTENTKFPRGIIPALTNAINYNWEEYYGYDNSGIVSHRPKAKYAKEFGDFLKTLISKYAVKIESCASNNLGLSESACLDPLVIEKVTGVQVDADYKDETRKQCQCYGAHGDMLKYSDVCRSCCAYCYAAQQNPDLEYRYYDDNGNLIDSALTRTSRVPTVAKETNLAETWSQKESWSTEYFNSKVLPKINEAWQIEYELAPDQTAPAKFKGNMTFDYGENGRSELKSKSTLEAIKNGERTATTRYESQGHLDYWKQAKVGDIIEWKRGDESVKVMVTKPLTKLRTSDATQQDLFAQEEVKPSETTTQFNELQQYANQVGLAEALPKVEEVKQAVEETKQIQDKYVYTFNDGLEVKLDFELNDQQKSALKELEAFVNGDDTSITLSGYAGTGKTTIMGIFNEYLKRRIHADIIFSAPTHRANAVTRQKTPNAKVVTLQSLLGLRPDFDITEDVFDLHKLKFEQVGDVKIEAASIVIVDEASMIQDSLYDFLLEQIAAKGAQIIFMGDKGQLRPVKANNISKVFRNDGAQLQLTKVERTGDNPILKESTRVRNGEGLSYETDIAPNGQGVEYSSDKTRIREFVRTSLKEMKDSQDPLYFRVLAATNSSVEAYNSAIRQILYGRRPAQLYEGELVMGYSNREYDSLRKKYKLMNSGDYVVQSVKPTTIQIDLTYPDRKESISMEGYKVTLKDAIDTSASSFTIDVVSNFETDENIIKVQEYIQTLWSMRKQLLAEGNPTAARSVVEKINRIQNKIHTMRDIKDANGRLKLRKSFDYGYAHTIHKSQGGTYSKVLINDSSINTFGFNDKNGQEVRQELKYVAVSRAKNYVMVQTLEKAKQQVVEDYDLDEEFVSATAADLKQAANDSATEELDKMGKQRKKECE